MHCDRFIGMAGHHPNRSLHFAPAIVEFHQIFVLQAQPLGCPRTHERGIVPGEGGQRPRQFLKPPVVGEPAIEDKWVRAEHDFETLGLHGLCGRGAYARGCRLKCDRAGRQR